MHMGPSTRPRQQRVLQRALEMGFLLIDTADAYGGGAWSASSGACRRPAATSSSSPRAAPTARPRRRASASTAHSSARRVERSLRRLGSATNRLYLLHNPSAVALEGGDAVDMLMELKAEGKIGHWGVSAGDIEVGRAALRCGAEVVELAYNLLHSGDLHRLAGRSSSCGRGRARPLDPGPRPARRGWTRGQGVRRGRPPRRSAGRSRSSSGASSSSRRCASSCTATSRRCARRRCASCWRTASCRRAVLGPRSVGQLEDLVREVGMGPIYLRDEDLMRVPRALESVGIEP